MSEPVHGLFTRWHCSGNTGEPSSGAVEDHDVGLIAPSRGDHWIAGLLVLTALAVYSATLTPSLSYLSPDGNELATIPSVLGLAHPPGYPLYTWLGKLFSLLPLGDVAFRMNLMSAALAACAVGGLYLVAMWVLPPETRGRRAAAALAALLFAFGPTFWSQAVITEVYAPNLAAVALSLLLLLRWAHTRHDRDFFFFALAFGLSLGMHLSDLGFAPGFALFILLTDWRVVKRRSWWLAGLAGFGLGAAQYLWVAFRLQTSDPALLLGRIPAGLAGLYSYTLGSFSELKFAFPWSAIPERVVVYLYLLGRELGRPAIAIGVIGLVSLLVRRPRHFHLLLGMYLVHLWFFLQYRAFDLEVFYLPAHFLWAIFVAFGVGEILAVAWALLVRMGGSSRGSRLAHAALAGLVVAGAALPLLSHWADSDRSQDVAIDDFYVNVWEMLPPESALLTPGGVFGYDAFYWRLIYGARLDVLLATPPSPSAAPGDLQGRALFSTTPESTADQRRTRWAPPAALLPQDAWQVPVLVGASDVGLSGAPLGGRARLTLYALTSEPPGLVTDTADPTVRLDRQLGRVTLIGADLEGDPAESGGRLHVVLYWRLATDQPVSVSTGLDGENLETHALGFGNLARYQAEIGPFDGRIVVEDFWLVIPSSTPAGRHTLTVRVGAGSEAIQIAPLAVVDREGRLERWLSVAG